MHSWPCNSCSVFTSCLKRFEKLVDFLTGDEGADLAGDEGAGSDAASDDERSLPLRKAETGKLTLTGVRAVTCLCVTFVGRCTKCTVWHLRSTVGEFVIVGRRVQRPAGFRNRCGKRMAQSSRPSFNAVQFGFGHCRVQWGERQT